MLLKLIGKLFGWKPVEDTHFMGVPPNKTPRKRKPVKHVRVGDYCDTCGKHISECPKLKNNQ